MRAVLLLIVSFSAALCMQAVPQNEPKRRIGCNPPQNAAECYWMHGRLQEYEGTPAYRLWKIGTKRLFGIYSGPSSYRGQLSIDNEDPEFPPNVRKLIHSGPVQVFGDFEICPLAPERAGFMRPVCLESAKNLFVQK